MIIFINGKQKRVSRPPMIDGLPVEEFIRRKADPIWLHQNEIWEYMPEFNDVPEPNPSRVDHAEDAPPLSQENALPAATIESPVTPDTDVPF